MKQVDVLKRPVLTEKANKLSEEQGRYTFEVGRQAGKLEIKKAVEDFYGVQVEKVNTMVVPGKTKRRYTKTGTLSGRKPSYKKAIITLVEGDSIDIFENI
ncbi:MAG TPA: 50S ribosomal protein L23 [Chitinophagaceae bacterium]|nr:50S ribosomal protein L23 [Chitinophagaceae bacterium]